MSRIAEFRSDTFTLPDEGMRQAIARAAVGNAGYGEDPSVNRLEQTMAEYFGCDAALFLPSATMAGQVATAVWCRPGDIVLIEEYGHSYYFETGAMSAIAGAQAHLLRGERGILNPKDIASKIRHPENTSARTGLVILENTSNFGGGTIYPAAILAEVFKIADENRLPVHIDGARIWNVITATACSPQGLMQKNGSMSVCFSKGLGAPMGAALLGSMEFIAEARRIQTMLGGVMRQVGFMAAAAQYAFENNLQRLEDDHANARLLATALQDCPGIAVDLEGVQSNMIYVEVLDGSEKAGQLVAGMNARGIRTLNVGPKIRFVTSMLVNRKDCEKAAEVLTGLLRGI